MQVLNERCWIAPTEVPSVEISGSLAQDASECQKLLVLATSTITHKQLPLCETPTESSDPQSPKTRPATKQEIPKTLNLRENPQK